MLELLQGCRICLRLNAKRFKVPQKQAKKGRLWLNDGSCVRLRPKHPNRVWSYYFVQDRTHDGRVFRTLNIIDEFTNEALVIHVKRKLNSVDVVVDDPARFTSSKKVGPWIGLTPSRNQSGERDVSGGITKAGDVNLRRALCQSATVMMHRGRSKWLRTWAAQGARRRGAKRAMVALARRIGVILHRMWVDDTDFRFDMIVPHADWRPEFPTVACLNAGLRGLPGTRFR